MPEESDVEKKYKWKLIASRPAGRAKIRWMHHVVKDNQAVKIVNWKRCAQDRNTVDSRLSASGLTALRLNRGNVFLKKIFSVSITFV
jgi:hypothetical protein